MDMTTVQIRPPKLPYTTVVREDYATDGSRVIVAEIPELPGCMSHGDTPEEALQNLEEAADLYLEALADSGQTLPPFGVLGGGPLTSGTEGTESVGGQYQVETHLTLHIAA